MIFALSLALGLIQLGQGADEANQMLICKLSREIPEAKKEKNVIQNMGIFIGLGLINFGNIDFYNTECYKTAEDLIVKSESDKEKLGFGLMLALISYRAESRVKMLDDIYQKVEGLTEYSTLALGLAYYQSNNGDTIQQLLLLSNMKEKSVQSKLAIQAVGLILQGPTNSAFALLSMCTRSYDTFVRAGACSALGQIFKQTGDKKVVELLCKMMSDIDE